MTRTRISPVTIMLFLAMFLFLTVPASLAHARWIHVDDDDLDDPGPGDPNVSSPLEDGGWQYPFDAIQEAIDAAVDGDEVIVFPGTYTGDGNRDLDYLGKAITVRSLDPVDPDTVAATIIDCQGSELDPHRGVWFRNEEGPDSVLAGLTITNGYMDAYGGAIFCGTPEGQSGPGAGPTITHCVLTGNHSNAGGGGIGRHGLSGMAPTILHCTITNNTTEFGGGGIVGHRNSFPMVISHCVIADNYAKKHGGGVNDILYAEMIIDHCVIRGNSVGELGAGIASLGGTIITNCEIVDNVSQGHGGGIAFRGNLATVADCLIAGNTANGRGGGIYSSAFDHTIPVTDCTFTRNTAGQIGGAICGYVSDIRMFNCILWNNSAAAGSEIALLDYYADPPGWPSILTVAYCDIQGGQAAVYTDPNSSATWGPGNLDVDPLFLDPDGPDDDPDTWYDNDYRLGAGSPCIDAADNDAVPDDEYDLDGDGDTSEPLPIDLRGRPRFLDDPNTADTGQGTPPIVDMGAYEFGLLITAWRSVKGHGSPHDPLFLSIVLDPQATPQDHFHDGPTPEPRLFGPPLIEVDFSRPVTLIDADAVVVTDGTHDYTPTSVTLADADTLALNFNEDQLPDQTCFHIEVAGVVEDVEAQPLLGDTDCWFRGLIGDVNGDGRVNLIDYAEVKQRGGGGAADPGMARFDTNTDGWVNLIDAAVTKQRNGHAACP